MAEVEMKWYVLRAVSGKEAKVKEYIDAEIKNGRLGGFVSQVFIPTEKVITTQGNKRVVKERLSMPGYILVEAKLVGEIAHELRSTPNCLGFLGGMENPVPLRDSEVNRILAQAEDPEEGVEVMVPLRARRRSEGYGRSFQRFLRSSRVNRRGETTGFRQCEGLRTPAAHHTWFYGRREGVKRSAGYATF